MIWKKGRRFKASLLTSLSGGAAGDTTAPTVTITSSESSPSFANPIPLTFTLSEVSTNFAVGDITVGAGGSIGNFAGSGASYTADLTVTTAGATITVDVAADSFTDAAGNGNTAAAQFSITSALRLWDQFTTADAAPVTSPRTCEPGMGTLTFTDTTNRLSISGGNLVAGNSATAASYDSGAALTRAAGLALSCQMAVPASGYARPSWGSAGSGLVMKTTEYYIRENNSLYFNVATTLTSHVAILPQRTAGYFYILDSTLLYVSTLDTTNRNVWLQVDGGATGFTSSFIKCAQLGSPWNDDYGIATNRVASPSAGETTTQIANALVEMTWTAVTGETWNLYVRRTDDTHTWCVRGDQGGSTVKLFEINGGETERATAAQTWTNGTPYRVVVIMDGNTIRVVVANALKLTYASASYNNTATGVKTDKAGANLIAWPRTISGAALTELNKINP